MHKILITGITGFLGSSIAKSLIQKNIDVIGLVRSTSNLDKCSSILESVKWVNSDKPDWKKLLQELNPDTLIHCAWGGVTSQERFDWESQTHNLHFLIDILSVAQNIGISKIIALGSQAEYGKLNSIVTEDYPCAPTDAYGAIKVTACQLLKSFSELYNIKYVWLRVFSVFGEYENGNWLIPSVIKKIHLKQEVNLSPCEQIYSYLYVSDFADIVSQVVTKDVKSGIYNLCSPYPIRLKNMLEELKKIINPDVILNYGALDYRDGQSLHIQGDSSMLMRQLGEFSFTPMLEALKQTVNFYI